MIFDLITEPWLPVVDRDGRRDEVGLAATVAQAHALRRIVGETPPMTAALYRLVLALLHRVYGPRERAHWAELWNREQFPTKKLDDYLEKYGDRFNLFDPERPFFQCADVAEVTPTSAAKLVPYRATGNNVTLFDHTTAGEEILLTPAEAARWLVTLQAYDPGGLKTPYRTVKQSQQAPANRFGLVLLEGSDLKETLLLNLLCYDPPGEQPRMTATDDRPVWEDEPPVPEPGERNPIGWTDRLTWPSRRVWLSPRHREGATAVDKVVITPGVRLQREDEPDDWMVAYRRTRMSPKRRKDAREVEYSPWRTIRLENLKGIWRYSQEFLLDPVHGEELEWRRPETLDQIGNLAVDGYLPADAVYTLRVLGQQLDSNGGIVEQVLEEAVSAPVALLRARPGSSAGPIIGRSVELADRVGDELRAMEREYARTFRTEQEIARLFKAKLSQDLELAYWPRLAPPFDEFLRVLGEAEDAGTGYERATVDWRQTVRRIAKAAADQWVAETPRLLGRYVEAAGRCHGNFLDQLRRHLSQYDGYVAGYPS